MKELLRVPVFFVLILGFAFLLYPFLQRLSMSLIGRRFKIVGRRQIQTLHDIWDPLFSGILLFLPFLLGGIIFAWLVCLRWL